MAVGSRLPPRQIEQDVGHVGAIFGAIEARRGVGRVLLFGDPRGLGVRGAIRGGIDRRAGNVRRLGQCVGVNRHEKRDLLVARHPDALAERNKAVVIARQNRLIAPIGLKLGR